MLKLDPKVQTQLTKVLQSDDNALKAKHEATLLGEMLGRMALPSADAIHAAAPQLYKALSTILSDEGNVLNAANKVTAAFHRVVMNEATDPAVLNYNKMMIREENRV
ncbi:MAG: hypothetical protein Q8O67_09525 [Deltaproteobacteria bacterium]|nr:hypothetical protein [Deltaproteobacteria bacterium]